MKRLFCVKKFSSFYLVIWAWIVYWRFFYSGLDFVLRNLYNFWSMVFLFWTLYYLVFYFFFSLILSLRCWSFYYWNYWIELPLRSNTLSGMVFYCLYQDCSTLLMAFSACPIVYFSEWNWSDHYLCLTDYYCSWCLTLISIISKEKIKGLNL